MVKSEGQCVDHPKCREDLITRINQRMTLKNFLAGLGVVVAIIMGVFTIWYNSYSSAEDKQTAEIETNHQLANDIKSDVGVIKTKQEYLHERMKKLGLKLDTIGSTQQEVLQELIKLNTKLERDE